MRYALRDWDMAALMQHGGTCPAANGTCRCSHAEGGNDAVSDGKIVDVLAIKNQF